PERTGCLHCGACMLGCRHGAKNSLDKNYLWLAERLGAEVVACASVVDVAPLDGAQGKTGYRVGWRHTFRPREKHWVEARGVVFAGGVLGTVALLLRLKNTSLPRLSERVGRAVRTNSESLLAAISFEKDIDLSRGVAISSILHTDARSHLEVVRYNAGSGFFRLAMAPATMGRGPLSRLAGMFKDYFTDPMGNWRGLTVDDLARRSQILLFMRTTDGTLRLRLGRWGVTTDKEQGDPPTPFIPEAHDLARRFARHVGGKVFALATETALGIPSTAHILGGACIGDSPENGVVAPDQTVLGYRNLWVCDGSAVSANPGVNPSLTICAQTERAMSLIAGV
ncbi:MAG: GMC oxidoreductase, partial [Bacteroidia bacterium]|nr:GMC oxidoreductase [Bacteroidia bacterium]